MSTRRNKHHDFRDVCFVIMPFGVKTVGTGSEARAIDFDSVFEKLFAPAVGAVELPATEGGGYLRPVRTDRDYYSGHIDSEMFHYIEYSRFALVDITSLNPNVFYELGARHRAHESGTAIFRQGEAAIPFDINKIKAFPYAVDPESQLEKSKSLVTEVLTNSLVRNAWDSPIMLALRAQREGPASLQELLRQADNALRDEDFEGAHHLWVRAAELDPTNPLHDIKASDYPKRTGDWGKVVQLLHAALAKESAIGEKGRQSTYSDAYRELGIAQNKMDKDIPRAGEESLRRATLLAPEDFDAWASLGGVLRRAGDDAGALAAYEKAVKVSCGHPYPLLMALKLKAKLTGAWVVDPKTEAMVGEAKGFRSAQVRNSPPIDVPWSFFDLAEIHMYLEEDDQALEMAKKGLELSEDDWMPGTFLSAMEMLPPTAALPGLDALKQVIRTRIEELRESEE